MSVIKLKEAIDMQPAVAESKNFLVVIMTDTETTERVCAVMIGGEVESVVQAIADGMHQDKQFKNIILFAYHTYLLRYLQKPTEEKNDNE